MKNKPVNRIKEAAKEIVNAAPAPEKAEPKPSLIKIASPKGVEFLNPPMFTNFTGIAPLKDWSISVLDNCILVFEKRNPRPDETKVFYVPLNNVKAFW